MSGVVAAVLLPLVVGAVLVAAGRRVRNAAAGGVGAVTVVVSGGLLLLERSRARGTGGFAGEVDLPWIGPIGARWHLGLDGLALPFCLLTVLLGVVVCLHVALVEPDVRAPAPLVGLLLLVVGSSLGVFCSLDLLVFLVFFELALVPMWFVVARWGSGSSVGRRRAATRFLLFTVTGSALVLAGFVSVARTTGTLQLTDLTVARVLLDGPAGVLAATAVVLGLAVKTPVWPLHTWLPDAHATAPTTGSVLLAGVLLKLGTFGLLRVWLGVAPGPAGDLAPWLGALAVTGIVWSALVCLQQRDVKRLVAYSSVGHMGFVVLGVSAASPVGAVAAVLGSVGHGLVSALLFVLAGAMRRRWGSTSLDDLGRGLYRRTPVLAGSFCFAAVASLGLPGLAVFWGELLALRAAWEVGPVLGAPVARTLLVVAVLGVLLTSAYVVVLLRRVLQGVPTPDPRDRDLDARERALAGVLAVAVVAVGVAPGLVVGVVEPDLPLLLGGVR